MWRKPALIASVCLLLLLALAGTVLASGPAGSTFIPVSAGPTAEPAAQPVDHTFWYLSRATGLTAYLLVFAAVCLGLAMSAGLLDGVLTRWRAYDLHESASLIALAFTALHMLTLLGDHYMGFTLVQLLVPFSATYRPVWTAAGLFAFYLAVVIAVSYYARLRIGRRTSHALHYAGYGAFLLALGHAVLSGSDTGASWVAFMYSSTAAAVAVLTLLRFARTATGERSGARLLPRQAALRHD